MYGYKAWPHSQGLFQNIRCLKLTLVLLVHLGVIGYVMDYKCVAYLFT